MEEELRVELEDVAFAACREKTRVFGECAKKAGIGVVLFCRQENAAMNKCLDQYLTDDKLEAYVSRRTEELRQSGNTDFTYTRKIEKQAPPLV